MIRKVAILCAHITIVTTHNIGVGMFINTSPLSIVLLVEL